jgi:hypothetical protein
MARQADQPKHVEIYREVMKFLLVPVFSDDKNGM